jgi:hypothetical protein|eukprot:COSAG01_NODE_7143_length_3332_cov_6.310238_1_plen_110_part_00
MHPFAIPARHPKVSESQNGGQAAATSNRMASRSKLAKVERAPFWVYCSLLWVHVGGWGRAPSTSTGGRARGGGYVGATSAEALLSAGHGGSRGALRAVVACPRQRGRGL